MKHVVMSSRRVRDSKNAGKHKRKRATDTEKKKKKTKVTPAVLDIPPRSDDETASDADEDGNLIGLIASESEEEEIVHQKENLTGEEEAKELLEEFPYDRALLEETNDGGPRRSRRTRKSTKRFFHPDYVKTFMTKGGALTSEDVEDVYGSDSEQETETHSDEEESEYENDEAELEYEGYAVGC